MASAAAGTTSGSHPGVTIAVVADAAAIEAISWRTTTDA